MNTVILAEISVGFVALVAVVVVLLIGLLISSFGRKSSREGTGMLARETYQRDRASQVEVKEEVLVGASGREVERAARIERIGGELVPKEKGDVAPFVPPDPEALGVTRRQFLNRSIVAFFILGLSGFGAAVLAFLWPQPKGGFGSKIKVGKISDIKAQISGGKGFYYLPEGRMWLTEYPAASLDKAKKAYTQPVLNSLEAGVAVMYQKCPHLGCRVPSCQTSQWFECPCHGSQYNQAGEKKGGPAPRGMDRFSTSVSGGELTVDTGTVIQGPPIGTNTTGQEAEGPHCVGSGGKE
ncbi:MAG: Rieske 2Fe-2S domain-containing protein [Actinobacteria bacterium]|nr:Rieske 2Fe-2S domain-containing protein [Actinomycetota bacterium]